MNGVYHTTVRELARRGRGSARRTGGNNIREACNELGLTRFYRERLEALARSQFTWKNVPETIDIGFLERTLLYSGSIALMYPDGVDFPVALPWVFEGELNYYGRPQNIYGLGHGSHGKIETSPGRWVILYDNINETEMMSHIDNMAERLAETHFIARANLMQQNTPYMPLVKGGSVNMRQVEDFFADVGNFKSAIVLEDDELGRTLKESLDVVNLGVDFKANEIYEYQKSLWNETLNMLGISTQSEKKERLVADEVLMARESDIASMNSRLTQRVDFCKKVNEKFGLNLEVALSTGIDVDFPFDKPREVKENVSEQGEV